MAARADDHAIPCLAEAECQHCFQRHSDAAGNVKIYVMRCYKRVDNQIANREPALMAPVSAS